MRLPAAMAALALLATGAAAEDGGALYAANCAVCHQADGQGAPGVAPSLAGTLSRYAASEDGRRYLAQILISGMVGSIQTDTGKFRGLMPNFRDRLDDASILAVMTYVLSEWNKGAVAAEDVARARAAGSDANATHALRQSLWAAGP